MISAKIKKAVTPAKAGVQKYMNLNLFSKKILDSRFRGNDENRIKWIFYKMIKVSL